MSGSNRWPGLSTKHTTALANIFRAIIQADGTIPNGITADNVSVTPGDILLDAAEVMIDDEAYWDDFPPEIDYPIGETLAPSQMRQRLRNTVDEAKRPKQT